MFPIISLKDEFCQQVQLAKTYRKAGLIALAELTEARVIITECTKKEIPVYEKDPWGVYVYSTSTKVGEIEALSQYIGSIPMEIVDNIMSSGFKPAQLAVLKFKKMVDPVLLFKFYSGVRTFTERMRDNHRGSIHYYMELARWD